jgi:hypothetical protein
MMTIDLHSNICYPPGGPYGLQGDKKRVKSVVTLCFEF